jgi:hypothetical protein
VLAETARYHGPLRESDKDSLVRIARSAPSDARDRAIHRLISRGEDVRKECGVDEEDYVRLTKDMSVCHSCEHPVEVAGYCSACGKSFCYAHLRPMLGGERPSHICASCGLKAPFEGCAFVLVGGTAGLATMVLLGPHIGILSIVAAILVMGVIAALIFKLFGRHPY